MYTIGEIEEGERMGKAVHVLEKEVLTSILLFFPSESILLPKTKKLQEWPQRQVQTIIKQKKDHKRPTINTQERGRRLRPETEPPPKKTRTQHVFNDEG